MINRIKAFFSQLDDDEPRGEVFKQKHVAAAALLVEAANADGAMDDMEEAAIRKVLARRFDFGDDELDALILEGKRRTEKANQIVGFTRAIKEAYDYDQRVEILELLWEVAYADGTVDPYEANLLRRIGGLVYVSDKDRGAAKKRVKLRLGLE